MTKKVEIAAAGNVLVPVYLALKAKGYRVTREVDSKKLEFWFADKKGLRFCADDPLALLGLIGLYETRGESWMASDHEIDKFLARFG